MRKFFSDKKNVVMSILIGISSLLLLISSFWDVITPLSLIVVGATSIDVAYVLFMKYVKDRHNKVEEFLQDESTVKKKTSKFLRSEGKMNLTLLIILFFVMGLALLYSAINMLII